jgi:hypothetical protein
MYIRRKDGEADKKPQLKSLFTFLIGPTIY